MRTQYTAALFVALLVVSLVAAGTGFAVVPPGGDAPSSQNATGPAAPTPADGSETGATGAVAQFGSEAAFDGYVSQGLLRTEQRQPRSRLVFDNTLELTTDTPRRRTSQPVTAAGARPRPRHRRASARRTSRSPASTNRTGSRPTAGTSTTHRPGHGDTSPSSGPAVARRTCRRRRRPTTTRTSST